MSYLRTISISAALLIQTAGVHANNVDEDFQRCASAALQHRGLTANAISVSQNALRAKDFDHDDSRHIVEYRLHINNEADGEDLGTVTCRLSQSGDLVAAVFDQ